MNSSIIRQKFLEFFESKGHEVVASAPIVVKDDPTLMFTNAGMNQFKDYFLGTKPSPYKRVVDTQKCLRVSGKHNDLEEVGHDTYHHTMFEMLGNWSFGDYFKKEAIEWAWELLTEVYSLPVDRMYVSVFGGDESDGLKRDDEALGHWQKIVDEERIIFGSRKDNFWEMGETGPCGPCSEIHIDLRSEEEIKKVPGKDLVNMDHPQVVEIWNLVFMEFNRKESGQLEKLPSQHIDTGMGLERLSMAIQARESNYDTDVFTPLMELVCKLAGISYGKDEKKDIAVRVISDHIRAVCFAIADGQLPANTGAGYVIRRILRRAVRYGFTFLFLTEPFFHKLVPILSKQFKDVFPELSKQEEFVTRVILEEEISFLHTLENGLKRIDQVVLDLAKKNEKVIPGHTAFELYDTFGFPFDLTSLIARERGFSVDMDGFQTEMAKQKSRSKTDAAKETGDWQILIEDIDPEFIGYENLSSEAQVARYRKITQKGKDLFQVVLDKTPFYAESGGQVGDTGFLEKDGKKYQVIDTQKEHDLIIHLMPELPSDLTGTFDAVVDREKRGNTMNNHSATHLMHAALREVLGEHVEQRGSLVNHKILRFDFSHFSKLTDKEIKKVEEIVNSRIRQNIPLSEQRNIPIDKALEMGAMALFGEKYGENVRVIMFDKDFSVELCGGTHVPTTGRIGTFKIINESSISSGVRRIEAVTADEAEKVFQSSYNTVHELSGLLKTKDVLQSVKGLVETKSQLEKEIDRLRLKEAGSVKDELLKRIINRNGENLLIQKIKLPDAGSLKKLTFDLKNQVDHLYLVLAADIEGKPQISVAFSDDIVEKGLDAGKLIRELASEIKGGGGGQPFFATAGGKDINGLDKVVRKAKKLLELDD